MHQSGIISLATLQLQIENTYSTATINSCCGFDFNTHLRPKSATAGATYGKTVACGIRGERIKYEIDILIVSERNKTIAECGGLSYGKKRSLAALGVTLFHITQPEGNDEGGSDYNNTASPHHQDLCPG